jgi:hypothetical protein
MTYTMILRGLTVGVLAVVLVGCAASASKAVLDSNSTAVQLRSYQSRVFDTTDKEKTLRTIIATLQDLGFVVDKADATLGSVSATKLSGYDLRMTVTVRPKGSTQLIVRANAQYQTKAVEEPKPYQDFFAALEKSMFLTAQQVD